MARTSKLKVFRTPIGFHDAYVAAPSQKAALAAWGSEHDLFGRGEAEIVTDAALAEEPLAKPGTVIKRLRGSADEQFAALPPDRKREADAKPGRPGQRVRKRPPHPDRTPLDRAEEAVAAAEHRHDRALDDLADEEQRLRDRRRTLEKARDGEIARLRAKADSVREAYDRKLEAWRGS